MPNMKWPYQHAIPPELQNASNERILTVLGQQGQNASKQGVSVARYGPWHVVATLDAGNRLRWIVVDTGPVPAGPPIKVMGPVGKREEAEEFAKTNYEIYRMEKTQIPEWPWE